MRFDSYTVSLCSVAALIRGNRNNCTQFSNNLDWLVSKLERLESSSGTLIHTRIEFFSRLTACLEIIRVLPNVTALTVSACSSLSYAAMSL